MVAAIGVVETFGAETVVNIKTIPFIPVAIGILAEVVVAIVTKDRH